jgi:radical SAM protein with 4Fe4S-binding SPASM domain
MKAQTKPRYRMRREWNGLELFDRDEGRVIPVDENKLDFRLDEMVAEIKQEGYRIVEPLIDTQYPKVPDYASAPRRIYWELTRRCNLNCRSCFNRRGNISKEMSKEDILRLASILYDAGVYEIRCTGGEPTQRDDLFEILEALSEMGFYISLATNGIYSKDTLQKLIKSPVDWIILSVDGANEASNAEIRGLGNYARVMDSLRSMKEIGCRIRINTLIRRGHFLYQHLEGLAKICEEQGVESLNCIPLRPVTNDPDLTALQLNAVEFKEFILSLKRLKKEYTVKFVTTLDLELTSENDRIYFKDRSCAAGREGAVISPDGDLYGCSYSPASDPYATTETRSKYVAGNLLQEDFLEIWNDSSRWAIYRDLKKYKHMRCKICNYYLERRCIGNCPIMTEDPAAFDPYCYLHLDSG